MKRLVRLIRQSIDLFMQIQIWIGSPVGSQNMNYSIRGAE